MTRHDAMTRPHATIRPYEAFPRAIPADTSGRDPTPPAAPGPWTTQAACADPGLDPLVRLIFTTDDWTPFDSDATNVCRHCPVQPDCAHYAATAQPVTGIWGGWRHLHPVPLPAVAVGPGVAHH